jgi:para-nitrobenzyl esterase
VFMSKLTRQVGYPVVRLEDGLLGGIAKEGGYIFRGVRYACAQRFGLAQPLMPWNGIQEARSYGYAAPELNTRLAADQFQQMHYYTPQDENCQYLNIWTQHLGTAARRPVVVWFHGGGWNSGSSVEQFAYDGENMSAAGDVVFVSVEHRLNCLGALDLSDFGPRYADSVYAGLSDALAALRWIRANIAAFGGDPGNVTLIGHAGGGPQVMTLLNTPAADGLYHKAALGGNVIHPDTLPAGMTARERACRVGRLTAENLGLNAQNIREIETVPYWYLAEAAKAARAQVERETGGAFLFEPLADGIHTMPFSLEHPLRPETADIPMLFGGDFGDANSNFRAPIGDNRKDQWDEATVEGYLREMYGSRAPALAEAYRSAYPGRVLADLLFIDRKARYKCLAVQNAHTAAGGKAWNWIFAFDFPTDGGVVPWHCSDNAYITANACYMEASYCPGVSETLQRQLCGAYTAFAERGDPNHAGLPVWKPSTPGHIRTMLFDRTTTAVENHDAALQQALAPFRK